MEMNEYQDLSKKFARYANPTTTPAYVYPVMGLCGESGEVAEEFKKATRADGGVLSADRIARIKLELGDVLWYLCRCADHCGIDLDDIARSNIQKLQGREKNDTLHAEGANR